MKRKAFARLEETLNAATHGFGALVSALGLVLLVVWATSSQDPWKITGASVFGASMLLLYLASTGYHSLRGPRIKRVMRSLDHAAIYCLIAGTYTPFLLINLRGFWGWTLFAIVWGAAVVGCAVKIFYAGHFEKLSVLLYLAMGWVVLIALKPASEAIPFGAGCLVVLGGLIYTLGVAFYRWERLPFNHVIWHLFVMGGSTAHFFAVLLVVSPGA